MDDLDSSQLESASDFTEKTPSHKKKYKDLSKKDKARLILEKNKKKLKKNRDTLANTIKFQQRRIAKYEEALLAGDGDKNAARVFLDSDFEGAPTEVKEAIEEAPAIWKPNSDVQVEFLSATEKEVLFSGGRGPLAYGEKVLTPNGFKDIEFIKVGDWVVCPDNSLSRVIAVPFDGEDDCYEFVLKSGRTIKSGLSHIWPVKIDDETLNIYDEILKFNRSQLTTDQIVRLWTDVGLEYLALYVLEDTVLIEDKLIGIRGLGSLRCKCITIDDPRGLFITTDFIVTHNSGKSSALLVDPLRYCDNKNFRGLIIRRTMPELRELIGRAKEIYTQAFPGIKWKEQDKYFIFPSGAKIEFGYCDSEDDLLRYQGQEYQWIGVDELTQFPTESFIEKLLSSLRSTDTTLPKHFRATTNPSGPGVNWVKKRYIDLGEAGKKYTVNYTVRLNGKEQTFSLTRKWFHSTILDNKTLMANNPDYIASLASLEDARRNQWLYGSWDSAEGLAFNDFVKNKDKIVIKPFEIPNNWERIRGCDWGYSSPAVCLWVAFDYDGTAYVYRELAVNGKKSEKSYDASEFAKLVLDKEKEEYIRYGVLDSSVWSQRGESSPSVADTMMYLGCIWTPSDRSPGSRKSGKMLLHDYFKLDELTGEPKIKIFDTCKTLISELSSLEIDDKNNEDVDTDGDDHAYDALRYALASRPYLNVHNQRYIRNFVMDNEYTPINSTFGY